MAEVFDSLILIWEIHIDFHSHNLNLTKVTSVHLLMEQQMEYFFLCLCILKN